MAFKSLLPSLWDKDHYEPFHSLQREIDRVFHDFSRNMHWPAETASGNGGLRLMPRIDVSETDGALEVSAELPGVDEKDIDVTIADNVMTIKGEKKVETKTEDKNYHVVERSYGSFQRSIQLPFDADADKIEARFEKGVLKVTLPKPPEVEAKTRKIEVQSAA